MRILRCLLAIALVCALSGVAKAEPVDFQMVVVDPFTGPYTINPITSTSLTFSFFECEEPGQLPAGAPFDGCFTGQNETGQVLTSLEMKIPLFAEQTAGCAPFGSGLDIFATVTCTSNPNGYLLDFSGGQIVANELFTVAEAGVDADAFPQVAAAFNTPEPSSIWLFATGVLTIGFFFTGRRQRVVRASRLQ